MKKILLFAALFTMSIGAFAQSGKLTIINNSKCTVYITMYATEGTYDPLGCDLASNPFIVPPVTTLTWADPSCFTGYGTCTGSSTAVGWAYQAGTIPVAYWTSPCCSTADFTWTDAVFQVSCAPCALGNGLTDGAVTPVCWAYSTNWAGYCNGIPIGTPDITAAWSSSGVAMNDITITFS